MSTINFNSKRNPDLSTFSAHPVGMHGLEYPTVEHAFQAAKFSDHDHREAIRRLATPKAARALGRKPHDSFIGADQWRVKRVEVMETLTKRKFERFPELTKRLINSEPHVLNHRTGWDGFWGDQARGQQIGDGQNQMGHILMALRASLMMTEQPSGPTTDYDPELVKLKYLLDEEYKRGFVDGCDAQSQSNHYEDAAEASQGGTYHA